MSRDKVTFEWATEEHAQLLADTIREEERLEVRRHSGRTPLEAILRSIRLSDEAFACFGPDGRLLCITGVTPWTALGEPVASPWLLTSTHIKKHPKLLLWGTKLLLERWRERYVALFNQVDAEYTQALRWAKWAGFTVHEAMPRYGHIGGDFHVIEMRGKLPSYAAA